MQEYACKSERALKPVPLFCYYLYENAELHLKDLAANLAKNNHQYQHLN